MIALGYIRRSAKFRRSAKSDAHTVSLESQRQAIETCAKRLGCDLTHVCTDDGVSGRKRSRFARLDEAVKEFRPNLLIVYHLDRLARDVGGLLDYLQSLADRQIRVIEASSGTEIDLKDSTKWLGTGIQALFAEYFPRIVSEKTIAALGTLKGDGLRYSHIPPLGYCYNAGRMVPDAEEQRGLTILRACAADGLGARRAIRVLDANDYKGRRSLNVIHKTLSRMEEPQT